MRRSPSNTFVSVTTQGGLFSPDFLLELAAGTHKSTLPGLTPADYHLPGSEKLSEAINHSWNTLRGRWEDFKTRTAGLAPDEAATGLTRDHWLLPIFHELGYGRIPLASRFEIEGREYPVSHLWGHTPIHLLGVGLSLDTRTAGAAGAARMSPHAMLQEFLNRSQGHLWGMVSNGLRLRLLRDNMALTRQAYVEFDLQAMFDGNHFADFALLWVLCHESRVDGDRPELCWLEKWTHEARKQGVRLLEHLREGVEQSIVALGTGFIAHPANQPLRDRLRTGQLDAQDYYRQVLRYVYRLIFLFVAEDRDVLLLPELKPHKATPDACRSRREARERYGRFYSTRRLRDLALKRAGTLHPDLWEMLRLVTDSLGSDTGCPALALPALGSFLWSDTAVPDLAGASLSNRFFLDAIRALASTKSAEEKVRRIVDYRNLGAEELGSVYESLLELHPRINLDARRFTLATSAGNERKTSGSHYTPDPLVMCLIESALDPVIQQRLATAKTKEEKERALLSLKVCDKACGSGHFLIRAGHRIARHLAAIRTGEEAPSPEAYRQALRDVIGRCLYGVDINPMAVELCKINLWLEALEPGKPLSFLDRHIRCGNSLLGATPDLIAKGIPDGAYDPIEGDDKAACSALKRLNARERKGYGELFALEDRDTQARLQQAAAALDDLPDDKLEQIRQKAEALLRVETDPDFQRKKLIADTWCAAFLLPKLFKPGTTDPVGITQHHLNSVAHSQPLPAHLSTEINRLALQYQFVHFHLLFPEVFAHGGFDADLGNPPWENLQADPQEFFAASAPSVANASNMAERNRLIRDLALSDPALHSAWIRQQRDSETTRLFLKSSQRYPLSTYGRLNTYGLFAELGNALINHTGRSGLVLPIGIATDAFNQYLFSDIVKRGRLVSLFGFENEDMLFPQVHHSFKFALVTVGGEAACDAPELAFFLRSVADLSAPGRRYQLTRQDFELINPNTVTCPVFRAQPDAALTALAYRRWPVILRENPESNPWRIKCQLMFMMNTVSEVTFSREQLSQQGIEATPTSAWSLDGLTPLYEAKMFHQFDHRFGTYDGQTEAQANQGKLPELTAEDHSHPFRFPLPRYWLKQQVVREALGDFSNSRWFVSWRDVTSSVVLRTVIVAVLPFSATNDSAPLAHFPGRSPKEVCCFVANMNSFVLDFVARQKLGGNHLRFFTFYQLPVLTPQVLAVPCPWSLTSGTLCDWLMARVLELTYTAWDLEPFAQDCGCSSPPFRWEEERRFLLRCELDAAFFHLYLGPADEWQKQPGSLATVFATPRDAVAFIMDTFPIVKRRDEAQYGTYHTKDTILTIYDALAGAQRTGIPYQTRLDPPPADPRCCHPPH